MRIKVILEIPLENVANVFMRTHGFSNEHVFVLERHVFRQTWGDEPYNAWTDDEHRAYKKYEDIEKIFAASHVSPVELPEAGFKFGKIHLDNGMTRTSWLLVNKAEFIPLSCVGNATAMLIHQTFRVSALCWRDDFSPARDADILHKKGMARRLLDRAALIGKR